MGSGQRIFFCLFVSYLSISGEPKANIHLFMMILKQHCLRDDWRGSELGEGLPSSGIQEKVCYDTK